MVPFIALSSSRKPPTRARQLINQLSFLMPQAKKINRGHLNSILLAKTAYQNQCKYLFILFSRKGNPSSLSGYKIVKNELSFDLNWIFDWKIQYVLLQKELDQSYKSKKELSPLIKFKFIPRELEKKFQFFSKSKENFMDSSSGFVLEYLDPGFQFYPFVGAEKIPPIIQISEIVISDDKRSNIENGPI